jgi:hypothetical protein
MTGEIDYDEVERLALEHKPKMIIAGFSAYSRTWTGRASAHRRQGRRLPVRRHGARRGPRRRRPLPEPVPFADVVTTTTHKTLRGPRGGLILARANDEITKKLNSLVFPGTQGGPLMHVIAAKAVAFKEALQPEFKVYQQQVSTTRARWRTFMRARLSHRLGRHRQPPVPGRPDRTSRSPARMPMRRWAEAHITVNKNAVPNDPRPPAVTSGLRIGTPGGHHARLRRGRNRRRSRTGSPTCSMPTAPSQPSTRVRGEVSRCAVVSRSTVPDRDAYLRRRALPVLRPRGDQGQRLAAGGEGVQIRRRRECLACGERFTTFETAELVMPLVVKSDQEPRALR